VGLTKVKDTMCEETTGREFCVGLVYGERKQTCQVKKEKVTVWVTEKKCGTRAFFSNWQGTEKLRKKGVPN